MTQEHLLDRTTYEARRQPIKRKCVYTLRELIRGVPELGSVNTFLKQDRNAQDAVYTLIAMGYRPVQIIEFVASPRFDRMTILDILANAASRSLLQLLKGLES